MKNNKENNKNALENLDLYVSYANLNHEVLSKPFTDYVRDEYGWTQLQFSAICYLKRNKILSMSSLADMLSITRQQATQLVDSLNKKQLIVREQDNENRRMVYVRPTELAVGHLLEAETAFAEKVQDYIGSLPEELQIKVNDAIRVMTAVFSEYADTNENIMKRKRK